MTALTLSADQSRVITGSTDTTICVWEINTLKELHSLTGHKDTITGLAVSSDDFFFVSSSMDNSIRIWDANELIEVSEIVETKPVRGLALAGDNRHILSSSGRKVKMWHFMKKNMTADQDRDMKDFFSPGLFA